MPVILPREAWDLWLDPAELPPEVAVSPLIPFDARAMQGHVVSRVVNKVGNDTAECVEPLAELA